MARKLLISLGALMAMSFAGALLPWGPGGSALAQDQSTTSLGDAARKAREQKKSQPPVAKVFTNDDISSLKGSISVVGVTPAAPDAKDAATKPAGTDTSSPKDEAYWRRTFEDARKKLAADQKEEDILQREYNLKQQQYYSDPNTALRQEYSRSDLTDQQAQIDAKKQDIVKDNQAISDLEDALRQAGGDPGWEREDTTPDQGQQPAQTQDQQAPVAQPQQPAQQQPPQGQQPQAQPSQGQQ